jgi:hypothetical protein
MGSAERLPDNAPVVRCGQPPFEKPIPLCERCVYHEGFFGFSVQCVEGVSLEQLAYWCPNQKIGVTTVGEVRVLGYDVVVTSSRGHHATVVVPVDWDRDGSESLVRLFREEVNPMPRKPR